MLTETDLVSLVPLCIMLGRADQIARALESEPLTAKDGRGRLGVHPLVRMERATWAEIRSWSAEFGLTPDSAARLGLNLQ